VFTLVIEGPGEPRRRMSFAKPEILIGRSKNNQLVLPRAGVSRLHARLSRKQGWPFVEDMGSGNGTLVNGAQLRAQRRLYPGDRIQIESYTITFEQGDEITVERVAVPVEAVEERFLAGIAKRDDASRLVYADWLEERGQISRAEFLRAQQLLIGMSDDDPRFHGLSEGLRELSATIDVQWRRKIARPAIENCGFALRCPKEWGALAPTARSHVKHCDSCNKDVFYCIDVSEARQHASRGVCVAIDIASARWQGDLEPPFGSIACHRCGADLGLAACLDKCPSCGKSTGHVPRYESVRPTE
jgi:uncharacterized protein (TIGR02996 family)